MTITMSYTCGDCQGQTSWSQQITHGANSAAVTCSRCGERRQITFEVFSLQPLSLGNIEMRTFLGVLKDGTFFSKAQLS